MHRGGGNQEQEGPALPVHACKLEQYFTKLFLQFRCTGAEHNPIISFPVHSPNRDG